MIFTARILTRLYGPAVMAVICISLCFFASPSAGSSHVNLSLFGIVDLTIPLSNAIYVRALLILAGLAALATYLWIDFSELFPSPLTMEVFFDRKGLADVVATYTPDERKALAIPDDYERFQHTYYADLDKVLADDLDREKVFLADRATFHSEGKATFVVKKASGVQTYHLEEASGELNHTFEEPGRPSVSFTTFFEKMPSARDTISVSIIKICITRHVMTVPKFKQMLSRGGRAGRQLFHHTVHGATKVGILPFPKIRRSLYLYEDKESEYLVPIAYAVYRDGE